MRTLLLIDANSIIHRSFHALPPFTGPKGEPTGALYGLSSIFLKLWREEKPDYAAALFDRPEPTFREKKYKEYKAHRPETPGQLISQIIEAHNLFPQFGIKIFEAAGFEADDIIATLAEKFKNENDLKIVILTGDRDTLQLVEGETLVVKAFKKGVSETKIYDEKAVIEEYKLKPTQLVDYKAFVGDPSDNIKGVPGVGPKTASDLLQKFQTLEGVFSGIVGDKKLEEKIGKFRSEAELSRELVILNKNVPVENFSLEDLKVVFEEKTLEEYFRKFGFETLIKRISAAEGHGKETKETAKKKKTRGSALL